jgi:hypothetical protein
MKRPSAKYQNLTGYWLLMKRGVNLTRLCPSPSPSKATSREISVKISG